MFAVAEGKDSIAERPDSEIKTFLAAFDTAGLVESTAIKMICSPAKGRERLPHAIEVCCELGRCEPVEARVRSAGVVLNPPIFNDRPCLVEIAEHVFAESLVAQAAVEALDKSACDVARNT